MKTLKCLLFAGHFIHFSGWLVGWVFFIVVTFTSDALFLILVKTTLYSSTDVWINKMWYIDTMKFSAIEGLMY